MTSGCDVKERCFTAIGISHKRNTDGVVTFIGNVGHGFSHPPGFFHIGRKSLKVLIAYQRLPGFLFRNHFYLTCFLSPERNFIADYFIFDGVLEGGVENNLHVLPLDESHLYKTLTETAVTVHAHNHRLFPGLKVCKYHSLVLRLQRYGILCSPSIPINGDGVIPTQPRRGPVHFRGDSSPGKR